MFIRDILLDSHFTQWYVLPNFIPLDCILLDDDLGITINFTKLIILPIIYPKIINYIKLSIIYHWIIICQFCPIG